MRRKAFFSEEKKQKTFVPAPADRSRPWPRSWERRRNKSLLLLFFRKEGLFLTFALAGRETPYPGPPHKGAGEDVFQPVEISIDRLKSYCAEARHLGMVA
jgi:hypothetical protein